MPEWIPIIISSVTTLMVCLINNAVVRKNAEAKQNETINLITYKIEELTKHVERHNQVIDRVYALEEKAAVCEERMKVANNRIADLERKEA